MGSLLGIILASKFDVPKLVLAAPALKVYDWRLKLTPLFSFLGYIELSNTPKYEYEGLNKIAEQYWNKLRIKPAANFYRFLQRRLHLL
ncbi:MAG: carboxylesterase [Thermotogaceae bacterium]|jgi:carboxylesterase|nr:carboxylesterase [Thermotogaceae bacterium]MDN5338836.1 carboxylesterase [Thermotogaceae bacterium]